MDENGDFFAINLFETSHSGNNDDEMPKVTGQASPLSSQAQHQVIDNLSDAIEFLAQPIHDGSQIFQCSNVISNFMGSMAQCRIHGKEINRLGGILNLMSILYALILRWELTDKRGCTGCKDDSMLGDTDAVETDVKDMSGNTECSLETELDLANVTLGALRDLACGNASNRLQIGQYEHKEGQDVSSKSTTAIMDQSTLEIPSKNGIEIISYFITRYNHKRWDQIPKLELRLFTNALGVVRNITHSTPYNCEALHKAGMTTVFIDRITGHIRPRAIENANVRNNDCIEKSLDTDDVCTKRRSLPDASKPWREACYRLAGSLINMAEKCHETAVECASDDELIWILIESWGGIKDWTGFDQERKGSKKKAIPVLHLGLLAVLLEKLKIVEIDNWHCKDETDIARVDTNDESKGNDLVDVICFILRAEEKRKKIAQERENARKRR